VRGTEHLRGGQRGTNTVEKKCRTTPYKEEEKGTGKKKGKRKLRNRAKKDPSALVFLDSLVGEFDHDIISQQLI
jgi:hypothetical protein